MVTWKKNYQGTTPKTSIYKGKKYGRYYGKNYGTMEKLWYYSKLKLTLVNFSIFFCVMVYSLSDILVLLRTCNFTHLDFLLCTSSHIYDPQPGVNIMHHFVFFSNDSNIFYC